MSATRIDDAEFQLVLRIIQEEEPETSVLDAKRKALILISLPDPVPCPRCNPEGALDFLEAPDGAGVPPEFCAICEDGRWLWSYLPKKEL